MSSRQADRISARSVGFWVLLIMAAWLTGTPDVWAVSNDNFVDAIVIVGTGYTNSGTSNADATKETGEPNHNGNAGGKSVWWTWTAPASGSVQIDTIGSSFDTIMGVYTGSIVNALTKIASDDEAGGNFTSKVVFDVTNGVAFRIAVDGYSGATGTIVLHLVLTLPSPPNIVTQPQGRTNIAGSTANFGVVATGTTPLFYNWRLNSTNLTNGGRISGATSTNLIVASIQETDAGNYSVLVSNTLGSVTSMAANLTWRDSAILYVWTNSPANGPGTNWGTAFRDIQSAVDAAWPNDTVLVTNGVYAMGGRVVSGAMTNRLVIDKAIVVKSVNGPQMTTVVGAEHPTTTNGDSAVRGVYMVNGAALVGFTINDGHTVLGQSGGGIYCESTTAVISNCVISYCSADRQGGGIYGGTLFNCILTTNWVCVQDKSGSAALGGGASHSDLHHCELTGNSAVFGGGGAFSSTLSGCTIAANAADNYGGGVNSCTLYSCLLTANKAMGVDYGYGGGSIGSVLYNCTLTGNSANHGGGAYRSSIGECYNSIIYYNTAPDSPNYNSSNILNYCCTWPLPSSGIGNVTANPGLAALNNPHLVQDSICIDLGNSSYTAFDIDDEARTNGLAVDIGCDEFDSASCTGALSVAISCAVTSAVTNHQFDFVAQIEGIPLSCQWQFGDGQSVANQPIVTHTYPATGTYAVVLRASNLTSSVAATVSVQSVALNAATRYVATNGTDTADGVSWTTAKATIQAAVSVTPAGGLVMVSNGVYTSNGFFAGDQMACVAITTPMRIQSVNGPASTTIRGQASVRCAYVCDGAMLAGFTLSNGSTLSKGCGGGAYCESSGAILSNCVISGCTAYKYGGGVYGGTLFDCTLIDNSAPGLSPNGMGGGAYNCTMHGCTLNGNSANTIGGGIYKGALYNCTLTNNWSLSSGGGAAGCSLWNCTLVKNAASLNGGGASGCVLSNCTLVANYGSRVAGAGAYNSTLYSCRLSANNGSTGGGAFSSTLYNCILSDNVGWEGGGANASTLYNCTITRNTAPSTISLVNGDIPIGGGVKGSVLYNCIVYGNQAPEAANYDDASTLSYCCTWPLPPGLGNFTNAPGMAGLNNFHLIQGSPCIDGGNNSFVSYLTDIDGEGRTNGAVVDVGCDEFWAALATGTLTAAITVLPGTNTVAGFPLAFSADIGGQPIGIRWQFGDGTSASNDMLPTHGYASAGDYQVVLCATNANQSVAVTAAVHVALLASATRYVTTNGRDSSNGLSWATAKQTIQSAIDVTPPCGLILVSNGIYASGGFLGGARVYLTNAVTVRSVNGPEVTSIYGGGDLGTTSAVRCARVDYKSCLVGFALEHGVTESYGGGGGIYFDSSTAYASNCIIRMNMASLWGGGAVNGTLYGCSLVNNLSQIGGGTIFSTLYDCNVEGNIAMEGGGVSHSTLYRCNLYSNAANLVVGASTFNAGGGATRSLLFNCEIKGNRAIKTEYTGGFGGGTERCSLYNCLVSENTAEDSGGGTYYGTLINCTVVGNTASNSGGGVWMGEYWNCIVCSNTPSSGGAFDHCCSIPLPPNGIGNIAGNPEFMDFTAGEFHLQASSPCINTGTNQSWMLGAQDKDGNMRITGGNVDMGCYEFGSSPAPVLPEVIGDLSFGVLSNRFGFNINWTSGRVVVVDASTNLAQTNWIPVVTGTFVGVPWYFSDPNWTNFIGRFYRIRSQP